MKLQATGLAVAILWGMAALGQAPPPMGPPPGYGPPPNGMLMPPGGPYAVPPGAPNGMLMPPANFPPQGPYPGMQPVMPMGPGGYPGPPMADCGAEACEGECGECCDDCGGFGRFGGCGRGGGCRLFGERDGGGLFGLLPPRPSDGGPCWRVRVEPVFLDFAVPDAPAEVSNLAGENVLGIHDLDVDSELNFRFSIERRLPGDAGLEVVLLNFVHWTDSALAVNDGFGLLQSPYQLINGIIVAAAPYDDALQHEIAYSSELHNIEVNYWFPVINHSSFQLSCMAGARYLNIEEDFGYSANDGTLFGNTLIHAENMAFGGQLGLMGWLPLNERVSARVDAKAGALYNFADQQTDIDVFDIATGAQLLDYSENPDTSKGSFVAELSGVVITQLNCNIGLYVGYQALWIDEFVFAPNQFNPVFPTAASGRPVTISDRGSRLYHGPLAGVEVIW